MLTVLMGKWAIFDGCTDRVGSEAWRLKEGPESLEWASSIDRKTTFSHVEKLLVRIALRWTTMVASVYIP